MALTPQQEAFARGCVELHNQSAAYRRAYHVAQGTTFKSVNEAASHIAALPEVAARIRELRDEAASLSAIPSLAVRIQEMREMECANPNDIIRLLWVNCRHCRGVEHQFQWADEIEYAQACDMAAAEKKKILPSCVGGFGFNPWLDPVKDCPRCFGVGIQKPQVMDTTKLTGGAKRLYKGVKIKGNGDLEILLHDQMAVRDMLNRIQGAYKDGAKGIEPPAPSAEEVAATQKTAEDRQRSYLRVVSS